jgi:hypothetical protein
VKRVPQNFYYEIAELVKKEAEAKYGGTWHVIVGRSFGSFVSYEVKRWVGGSTQAETSRGASRCYLRPA